MASFGVLPVARSTAAVCNLAGRAQRRVGRGKLAHHAVTEPLYDGAAVFGDFLSGVPEAG